MDARDWQFNGQCLPLASIGQWGYGSIVGRGLVVPIKQTKRPIHFMIASIGIAIFSIHQAIMPIPIEIIFGFNIPSMMV
ncbi:MAG: hypothetical protein PHE55_01505 [Methylococcaceae bacterium]|nr:hypothetical protein [Methylococcaceae bacterium]